MINQYKQLPRLRNCTPNGKLIITKEFYDFCKGHSDKTGSDVLQELENGLSDGSFVRECSKCQGTGLFKWGNFTKDIGTSDKVQSKPDHQGICYDCQGKGHQTPQDEKRVANYWCNRNWV